MRKKLIHWIARHLLPFVEEKEIIQFIQKKVYINGKELTSQEVSNLRAEVRAFKEFRLYKLLVDYPTNLAQKKMFKDAQGETEILFAKTILYMLDVQNNILSDILNAKN